MPAKSRPHGAFEGGFEGDADTAEKLYYATREAAAKQSIVLQVVGDDEPVRVLPLPPEGQTVRVSQLLEQTGVLKKLGGIEVTLFRHAPGIVGGSRMSIKMSEGTRVRPESDYSLRAGDRIRVEKISSNPLKALLDSTGI